MTSLLDASSVVEALLTGRVDATFDQHVLDLTVYEAGNALWKNHHLRDAIGTDRFQRLLALLDELRSHLTIQPIGDLDVDRTMTIAIAESTTFYDSAYVAGAEREDLTLVTEDRTLADAATRYVDVASIDDVGPTRPD